MPPSAGPDPPLPAFLAYFLRLGALGFGGPIALVGAMRRDLVEQRRWISEQDYAEGLALAQLAPGPLAAQLAIYVGWVRSGITGATLAGLAFVLPSFVMVLALSWCYVRFGGLPWIQGLFYGIGPAAIALIARSAAGLARRTLAADRLLWLVFALNAAATVLARAEVVAVVLLSGAAVSILRGTWWRRHALALVAPPLLVLEPAGTLAQLAVFFLKAGALVFGSGLAIVPFLYAVVEQHHWLTEQQFLDAVAVAMITPGPVVITVAFIGYLVHGVSGAAVAALAVFAPCWLFTVVPAPFFRRAARLAAVRSFVDGVTAAATGAIAGAVVILADRAIIDPYSLAICVCVLLACWRMRAAFEPLVVAAAGLIGLVNH